jgi:hypothetical protein
MHTCSTWGVLRLTVRMPPTVQGGAAGDARDDRVALVDTPEVVPPASPPVPAPCNHDPEGYRGRARAARAGAQTSEHCGHGRERRPRVIALCHVIAVRAQDGALRSTIHLRTPPKQGACAEHGPRAVWCMVRAEGMHHTRAVAAPGRSSPGSLRGSQDEKARSFRDVRERTPRLGAASGLPAAPIAPLLRGSLGRETRSCLAFFPARLPRSASFLLSKHPCHGEAEDRLPVVQVGGARERREMMHAYGARAGAFERA